MKQIKYYVLAGLAMMMLLIGCTEDNSMTEIQKENEPTTGQDIPTDEVLKPYQPFLAFMMFNWLRTITVRGMTAMTTMMTMTTMTTMTMTTMTTMRMALPRAELPKKQHRITRSTSSNPLITTTSSWAPIANTVF